MDAAVLDLTRDLATVPTVASRGNVRALSSWFHRVWLDHATPGRARSMSVEAMGNRDVVYGCLKRFADRLVQRLQGAVELLFAPVCEVCLAVMDQAVGERVLGCRVRGVGLLH